jgi:hypothetical protein
MAARGEAAAGPVVRRSRGPMTESSARASAFGPSGSRWSWYFGSYEQRDGKTSSSGCRSRGRRVTWVAAGHGFAATSRPLANTAGAGSRSFTAQAGLCVPKLLRLAVRKPARSSAISRTLEGAEGSSSIGRQREHVRRIPGKAEGHAPANLHPASPFSRYRCATLRLLMSWVLA